VDRELKAKVIVLTAAVKKSPAFWHITLCGPLKVD
jgi:hypothetical protein